jgi:hypothetical protein
MNDLPIEPFYEKIPRLEREIMMVRTLGERDVEISRLREALGTIAVETTGKVREIALRVLGDGRGD